MNKKSEYEVIFWKCAYNQLGFYPSAIVHNHVERERTEWQNGWNEALLQLTMKRVEIEKWFSSLTEQQKDILFELIFKNNYLILDKDENKFCLAVNCNDVFMWGSADAEDCTLDDLPTLLKASTEKFGLDKWCCHKRNQRPQEPVIKLMKDAGVWDESMEALPK